MDAVFLLGSGTSINAGMPCVSTITDQALSGEGVFLHTNKLFVIDPHNPGYERGRPEVEPVLELVEDLRRLAKSYFEREPNYEDISQIAREIDDALSREYESPAVMPLVERLVSRPYAGGDRQRVHKISQLAHQYIRDTVRHMLDKAPSDLDHLGVIVEACKRLSRVTLATLNHDLVLEAALERAGLDYADGFEKNNEDVRLWVDEWFDASIQLLKLHGSLDWWGYRRSDAPWRVWDTGRFRGDDPMHPNRPGIVDTPQDMRPICLTGTFDKILAYETWIFPDQHVRFHEALRKTERVVVIGYGFGDKAINTRLIAWLARASEHTLIVCHPCPDELCDNARGAIQNYWTSWKDEGRLKVVPACVADLNYEAITGHLA
jgi:SIR2-like domain